MIFYVITIRDETVHHLTIFTIIRWVSNSSTPFKGNTDVVRLHLFFFSQEII